MRRYWPPYRNDDNVLNITFTTTCWVNNADLSLNTCAVYPPIGCFCAWCGCSGGWWWNGCGLAIQGRRQRWRPSTLNIRGYYTQQFPTNITVITGCQYLGCYSKSKNRYTFFGKKKYGNLNGLPIMISLKGWNRGNDIVLTTTLWRTTPWSERESVGAAADIGEMSYPEGEHCILQIRWDFWSGEDMPPGFILYIYSTKRFNDRGHSQGYS